MGTFLVTSRLAPYPTKVRGLAAVTAAVLLGGAVAACATVSGLDTFSKGECAGGDCDATTDVVVPEAGPDSSCGDSCVSRADSAADGCGPLDTPTNCTACGFACDTTHSSGASCSGTSCEYTGCASGWADCTKTAPDTNGCETQTNTATNCSACGVACDTAHSTGATCNGQTCQYSGCAAGWEDCITTPPDSDGCETYAGSTDNCGACGQTCDTTHSAGASCVASDCQYTGCLSGWADCNKTPPDTNGCETQTNSITNCGACGAACDTSRSVGASCNGTTCLYTGCDTGYADCNKASPDTDGCESSLTSTSSCGACGVACGSTNVATASCNGTTCSYVCASGWADCTTTAPNTDGCETPTNTTSNCSACGDVCTPNNATAAACSGLSCSYTCDANHSDCNAGSPPDTDGCECATPSCCAGGTNTGAPCQTTHTDGVGNSFYDCNNLSTFSSVTAIEACTAYALSVGGTAADCSDGWTCSDPTTPSTVCYGADCSTYCWGYTAGKDAGEVENCSCPIGKVGTWQ